MNISDGVERMGRRDPSKLAVVADDGERITYGQLDADANRIARILREKSGARAGDRIGILAGNSISFVQAFYGAIRAGCLAVPLNDEATSFEIDDCLDDCQPILILAKRGARTDWRPSETIVEIEDILSSGCSPFPGNSDPGNSAFALENHARPEPPARRHPFYIGYTSGSTGKPKGVLRSHGSWLDSYLAAGIEFQCAAEDRILTPGPIFFSLSLFAVTHALFLGSTAYIMSRFDPRRALEIISRERVTTLCAVPTIYEALLSAHSIRSRTESRGGVDQRTDYEADHGSASALDLRSVKTLICAGSTWPRADEAKRELLGLFPSAGLYEYYGAAEMSFVSVNRPEDQITRPRSVGRPFLGVSVEIRREDGTLAAPGEIGILYAQSSFGFEGYYGDSARTATVKKGHWMTVGDLASADGEGYIYIAGRKDNVVITAGKNVSVEEVEAVLAKHPDVLQAAVLGLHDRHRGQVLAAMVQIRAGASLGPRELRTHCGAHLVPYKVPRRIRIVDSIPTTATGKINRPEVARLLNEAFATSSVVGQGNHDDRD